MLIKRVQIHEPFIAVFAAFVRMLKFHVILQALLCPQYVFAVEWTFVIRLAGIQDMNSVWIQTTYNISTHLTCWCKCFVKANLCLCVVLQAKHSLCTSARWLLRRIFLKKKASQCLQLSFAFSLSFTFSWLQLPWDVSDRSKPHVPHFAWAIRLEMNVLRRSVKTLPVESSWSFTCSMRLVSVLALEKQNGQQCFDNFFGFLMFALIMVKIWFNEALWLNFKWCT